MKLNKENKIRELLKQSENGGFSDAPIDNPDGDYVNYSQLDIIMTTLKSILNEK
jgi:hypothetical protein